MDVLVVVFGVTLQPAHDGGGLIHVDGSTLILDDLPPRTTCMVAIP
ncbi:hypothetical protein [Nonomuraea turcica]|nr:hypothetical protein [Nonomuraea sp. G32]MDP4507314.1 hypothetical protein [Nonomuraea sp. G32]